MNYTEPNRTSLSVKDFKKLGAFIHSELGIKMPEAKRGMVESRLRRRLTVLKIKSYEDYCEYLFSPAGMDKELSEFINVVTTNKTDFFREPNQFIHLEQKILPELLGASGSNAQKTISVWSSACSRGHEPYTIAMVLAEFIRKQQYSNAAYRILGTDISTRVLDIAKRAVYAHEEIEPVSMEFRKRYLLKSRDREKNLVRIVPALRKQVNFRRLNLMDADYRIPDLMDIIFCRNVMIYFERPTQEALLERLCRYLKTGGYLFVGHSEVLQCKTLPLVNAGMTIYQKI